MKKARKNNIQKVHRPVEQKKGLCRNSAQYFVTVSLKRIGQNLSKEERRKEVSDFSNSGDSYQNLSSLLTRKKGNSMF